MCILKAIKKLMRDSSGQLKNNIFKLLDNEAGGDYSTKIYLSHFADMYTSSFNNNEFITIVDILYPNRIDLIEKHNLKFIISNYIEFDNLISGISSDDAKKMIDVISKYGENNALTLIATSRLTYDCHDIKSLLDYCFEKQYYGDENNLTIALNCTMLNYMDIDFIRFLNLGANPTKLLIINAPLFNETSNSIDIAYLTSNHLVIKWLILNGHKSAIINLEHKYGSFNSRTVFVKEILSDL